MTLYELNPWKTAGDVLVVGGGPIGLFTAAGIKALRPETDIHVYEKYQTYQRHHVVQIRHSSFSGAPNHPIIQQALEKIKAIKPKGWIWKTSTISTSEVEEIFSDAAARLGVKIHKGYFIQKPQDLAKFHSSTRFILGADGAHSGIRSAIFGDQFQTQQELNYVAEIKYFVKGETSPISPKELYVGCKKVGATISEHVGQMNASGETPITVRMILTKKDHESMQNATFKNPYCLEECPQKVREAFEKWKKRRENLKQDEVVPGSEKVSAVALSSYVSKHLVKKVDGVEYALFGDSAVGVPFFSSLNFGLKCASNGIRNVVKALDNPKSNSMETYETYVQKNAFWELAYARIKNFAIKFFGFLTRFNGLFPWQFIRDASDR